MFRYINQYSWDAEASSHCIEATVIGIIKISAIFKMAFQHPIKKYLKLSIIILGFVYVFVSHFFIFNLDFTLSRGKIWLWLFFFINFIHKKSQELRVTLADITLPSLPLASSYVQLYAGN